MNLSSVFRQTAYVAVGLVGCVLPGLASAAPTIGGVTPVTATTNQPVTLSASVSSAVPISVCRLYVDLEDVGEMTVAGGMANRSHTFPAGGSRIAFVFCRDANGGMAAGPNTAIWVEGAIIPSAPLPGSPAPTPAPTPTPAPAPVATTTSFVPVPVERPRLIKLACPTDQVVEADHPCKAVYFVGTDGKRRAFPNSRVFFTWYQDFSTVEEVSAATLASFPLARNVGYRPGVRLVKFTTVNKVYAVGRGGMLRWIASEEVARALYGMEWNTKVDDIPDAFYLDYTFGTDILLGSDFVPAEETRSASSIDVR